MVETKIIPILLKHEPLHHAYLIMVPGDNILIDPEGNAPAPKSRETIKHTSRFIG